MGLKWLITGGCGFIGANLIKELVAQGGHAVRVIDNLSVGTKKALAEISAFQLVEPEKIVSLSLPSSETTIELIVGDIENIELAVSACEGIDVIVHLAANTGVAPSVEAPRLDFKANVLGVFNYLEAARQHNIPRFIFASSGASTGEVEPPIHEEIPAHPVSPYGASKLAGEAYCSAYQHSYGVDTVVLRFGNVYGAGSNHKTSLVAKFINTVCEGTEFEIYGDGQQTRDFIFIADLIKAIHLAAQVGNIGGEIFQIASNKESTVREVIAMLSSQLQEKGINNINIKYGDQRQGDVRRNFADTTKAQKVLGWKTEMDLKKGLQKTVDYFFNG